jgi:O-antigen ligase
MPLREIAHNLGIGMLRWIGAKFEFALTIFAFSVFCGAFVNIPDKLSGADAELGSSNPLVNIAMALILVSSCALVFREGARATRLVMSGTFINGLLVWAVLSSVWSVLPLLTVRRSLSLATCIIFAYYAVSRFPMETIIRRLAIAVLIMAITSTIVAVAVPKIGIMTELYRGSWNGVFSHKNGLGGTMIVGVNVYGWMFSQTRRYGRRALYALIIAYFVCLTVLAQSMTSLVAELVLGVIALALWTRRLPRAVRLWCLYLLLLGVAGVVAMLQTGLADILIDRLGRDPSLTGRVPMWETLVEFIARRPLLGYGYGAFWATDNPYAQFIWSASQWDWGSAHNAYLDLLLQLGIPGLVMAVWPLLVVIRRCAQRRTAAVVAWSSFGFTYAVCEALTSFTETAIYRAPELSCMLLPACYLALQEHRRRVTMSATAARPIVTRSRLRFSSSSAHTESLARRLTARRASPNRTRRLTHLDKPI